MMKSILKCAVALSIFAAFTGEATAYTYRVNRCAALYMERNTFYNRKGLCFTRPAAKRAFPNNEDTCSIYSSEDLPMSANEKLYIDSLIAEERELACPRI